MKRYCAAAFLFLLVLTAGCSVFREGGGAVPASGDDHGQPLSAGPVTLDRLPILPELGSVEQFSSHNRKGLNGDAGWKLYDDERGDAVIFDVEGPGCVRSMWSTAIHEDAVFNFYFDGEAEPRYRIKMLDFYKGKHPLFPPPLVSFERRGYWGDNPFAGNSFVPIPFARGLRISVSGKLEFYHILCERYPHGTRVETFTGREDRAYLLDAFTRTGEAPRPLGEVETVRCEFDAIDPGKQLELLRLERGGCIRRIVLEGDGSDEFIRECQIMMNWDGHALWDVRAPVGFFFGTAYQKADMSTMALRSEILDGGRVRLTCWFPMPFHGAARVVLASRAGRALGPVKAEISVGPPVEPAERTAYFTALFRKGQTTYGRDWLFCESHGAGWFVGAVQSMMGEHYCEGDEHIAIDGAISPQINGTGSEDYYLACYWPNRVFNSPFANCVGDIQEMGGGTFQGSYSVPSCYSRFHLEAPIPFLSHLDARIQHGGISAIQSSYASLAYYYLRPRPALRQTDFIDVGIAASEAAHGYESDSGRLTGPVDARPEGRNHLLTFRGEGRVHGEGAISFTVAVDPGNRGVRLRRRLDQESGRQTADVYVNGRLAGTWYHADQNEHLRWFDSDFDIHPLFTSGEESLAITLKVRTDGGRGPFTDFCYWIFN